MNGVIGMTNLLMGTELSPRQMEYLKIAQTSGSSLVTLINEVLDLSKIEAGKMELESVVFDVRSEVDAVLSLFEDDVHKKQLELSAIVHDTIPISLVADPGRLRQIVFSLLSNSIKVLLHILSNTLLHLTQDDHYAIFMILHHPPIRFSLGHWIIYSN